MTIKAVSALVLAALVGVTVVHNVTSHREKVAPAPTPIALPAPVPLPPLKPGAVANTLGIKAAPEQVAPAQEPLRDTFAKPKAKAKPAPVEAPKPAPRRPISSLKPPAPPAAPRVESWSEYLVGHPVDRQSTR